MTPFDDSQELVRTSGLPALAMIEVGIGTTVGDHEAVRPIQCLKSGVDRVSRTKAASKYLLAVFMVGAGTLHFVKSDFFTTIIPPYLPFHMELVYLSGFVEVALGLLLLVPRFSRWAAWGIVALLFAVFPANIYLYQHQELLPASPTVHFLRLPLQGIFVLWAYWFTRKDRLDTDSLRSS